MGTRNLTMVIADGKTVVVQYGQWDGYPAGQGATALEFCREHLATAEGRDAFRAKLARCRFVTDEEIFDAPWPALNRDYGAKILDYIDQSDGEVLLQDESYFARDSLFCEWAYVIDLDQLQLEVYKGANRDPVPAGERFAAGGCNGYYPVRHVETFKLGDLPDKATFVQTLTLLDRCL